VLKHPQPKNGVSCNSARSDDFFNRGGDTCTCTIMNTSVISLRTALTNSPVSDYQLYFKIHRQLTIVEVLSEGTLLMGIADIHVN